jgi:succinate dehydrogenase / fumarate reductase, cytochrome b subunit
MAELNDGLSPAQKHFLLRRVHSLLGVLPIGGFLFFHLFENSNALKGAASFDHAVETIGGLPYLLFIEWGVLFLPILFHGIYGVIIALQARKNLGYHASYNAGGTWRFYIQRVTGILLLAFLAYHVWNTRIVTYYLGGVSFQGQVIHSPTYAWMSVYLHHAAWVIPFYAAGVACAAYHLANGLWSFAIVWGITIRKQSQDGFLRFVAVPVFLLLTAMGWAALSGFKVEPPAAQTSSIVAPLSQH